MDVSLTDEQLSWQRAVARLAADHATTGADLVKVIDVDAGWAAAVDLGLPSLRSPVHAGAEATGVEVALAVEQTGRMLSALPIVGQAVIVPDLLAAAGGGDALDAVVSGDLRLAPALTEDLAGLAHLGEPAVAVDAAGATHALLLALDGDHTTLVAVALDGDDLDGLDLTRRLVPVRGGTAPVDVDLGGPIAGERLVRARAVAMTALAADLLGVMDGAVSEAVAYAKDRRQFGAPIGSFQAVQHLLADAAVAVEGARGCVWHAAWSCDHEDVAAAVLAARTAKACCSEAGLQVVEATVQAFGGIAITWEHLSHVRLRRVLLDRVCLGDEGVQHRAIASMRIGIDEVA